MLDINYIKREPELFKKTIRDKGINLDLDELLACYEELVLLNKEINGLRERRNAIAKEFGMLKEREVVGADAEALNGARKAAGKAGLPLAEGKEIAQHLKALERKQVDLEDRYRRLLLLVPAPVLPAVPVGNSDLDNVELYRRGELPQFDFQPLDHLALVERLGLVDFVGARAAAGARAYALLGDLMLLEMAVQRYAVDYLVGRGFQPVAPPVMVRQEAMEGTGYFPLGLENAYELKKDDLFLTGTCEVGLVAMHRNRLFEKQELPRRLVGLSTCFRREAGAAGKDTRGLFRVHQFQKVEQVAFTVAEQEAGLAMHYELLENAEAILRALELPYRVVQVCTGDIGQGQVFKHDIETYMPARGGYFETHSCSFLADFQARRLNMRYEEGGKRPYVYTVNNTAAATPRLLIALLENHQEKTGRVRIPGCLQPYMGRTHLEPRLK